MEEVTYRDLQDTELRWDWVGGEEELCKSGEGQE